MLVVAVSALVGSVKASIEFNKNKDSIELAIDIMLGVICGMALVHYYTPHENLGLMALVAVIGGASGTLLIEVFLTILPTVSKDIITKLLKKIFS